LRPFLTTYELTDWQSSGGSIGYGAQLAMGVGF
jgi:hypothetical protein